MTDEAILKRKAVPSKTAFSTDRATITSEDSLDKSTETSISEELVAQYLKENPDFFLNWESILLKLKLPHNTGRAISLVEKQVAILRDRNMDLCNLFTQLIEAATENDALFEQTRQLTLRLMEAGSLLSIVQQLKKCLTENFDIDTVSLIFFDTPSQDITLLNTDSMARVEESATVNAHIGGLLRGHDVVCTSLRESEAHYLFNHSVDNDQSSTTNQSSTTDQSSRKVGSAAIVPLHYKGNIGLLSVGSYDPNHFNANIGTLFIDHIGEVLSRLIRPYMVTLAQT